MTESTCCLTMLPQLAADDASWDSIAIAVNCRGSTLSARFGNLQILSRQRDPLLLHPKKHSAMFDGAHGSGPLRTFSGLSEAILHLGIGRPTVRINQNRVAPAESMLSTAVRTASRHESIGQPFETVGISFEASRQILVRIGTSDQDQSHDDLAEIRSTHNRASAALIDCIAGHNYRQAGRIAI